MDDEMGRLYEHQTLMAVSIYSFLDNVLSHVRHPPSQPSPPPAAPDPPVPKEQVVAGGYAEDIFIFISDQEKEEYQCSVCYNILKDAHQCQNGHLFCYTCVYAWSTSVSGGSSCCPMCRTDGLYARNNKINERVGRKRVKCQEESCNWRGVLRLFDSHQHRHYEPSEIGMGNLPSIGKLKRPTPQVVNITSMQPTTQSTSEFLRSFNTTTTTNDNQELTQPATTAEPLVRQPALTSQAEPPSISQSPQPPNAAEPARNQATRRGSGNSGPRRIVRPQAQNSSTNNSSSTTQGRRSSSTGLPTNMPATRPGMIPRPPTQTRPPRVGSNTGVTQANRPMVARRPSRDVDTESGNASTVSSTATSTPTPTAPASNSNRVTAPVTMPPRTVSETTAVSNSNTVQVPDSASSTVQVPDPASSTVPVRPHLSIQVQHSTPVIPSPTTTSPSVPTHAPTRPLLQRERMSNGSLTGNINSATPVPAAPIARPESPALEYRRLAPIRQATRVTDRLRNGHDQLAMMLTLMSIELDDRRRNIERHAAANLERERYRLQEISEVHTLNRRLSMVANNLERLIGGGPDTSLPSQPRYQSSTMTIFHDSSSSDDED